MIIYSFGKRVNGKKIKFFSHLVWLCGKWIQKYSWNDINRLKLKWDVISSVYVLAPKSLLSFPFTFQIRVINFFQVRLTKLFISFLFSFINQTRALFKTNMMLKLKMHDVAKAYVIKYVVLYKLDKKKLNSN